MGIIHKSSLGLTCVILTLSWLIRSYCNILQVEYRARCKDGNNVTFKYLQTNLQAGGAHEFMYFTGLCLNATTVGHNMSYYAFITLLLIISQFTDKTEMTIRISKIAIHLFNFRRTEFRSSCNLQLHEHHVRLYWQKRFTSRWLWSLIGNGGKKLSELRFCSLITLAAYSSDVIHRKLLHFTMSPWFGKETWYSNPRTLSDVWITVLVQSMYSCFVFYRLHNLVAGRQQEKQSLVALERKLQDERKLRTSLEQQLAAEKKKKAEDTVTKWVA